MLKLSPGQAGDAPQGRELLEAGGPAPPDCLLIMDSAYEGDETLRLARQLGYTPIVPPNPNRLSPWEYDRLAYRRRNEIERLFRRLKGYQRVFCRFDKLDVLFMGFIVLALIVEALRFSVNRPYDTHYKIRCLRKPTLAGSLSCRSFRVLVGIMILIPPPNQAAPNHCCPIHFTSCPFCATATRMKTSANSAMQINSACACFREYVLNANRGIIPCDKHWKSSTEMAFGSQSTTY